MAYHEICCGNRPHGELEPFIQLQMSSYANYCAELARQISAQLDVFAHLGKTCEQFIFEEIMQYANVVVT